MNIGKYTIIGIYKRNCELSERKRGYRKFAIIRDMFDVLEDPVHEEFDDFGDLIEHLLTKDDY